MKNACKEQDRIKRKLYFFLQMNNFREKGKIDKKGTSFRRQDLGRTGKKVGNMKIPSIVDKTADLGKTTQYKQHEITAAEAGNMWNKLVARYD